MLERREIIDNYQAVRNAFGQMSECDFSLTTNAIQRYISRRVLSHAAPPFPGSPNSTGEELWELGEQGVFNFLHICEL